MSELTKLQCSYVRVRYYWSLPSRYVPGTCRVSTRVVGLVVLVYSREKLHVHTYVPSDLSININLQ